MVGSSDLEERYRGEMMLERRFVLRGTEEIINLVMGCGLKGGLESHRRTREVLSKWCLERTSKSERLSKR